jgi:ABC-type branched-subunit amino acid transport system substrate-binding protein
MIDFPPLRIGGQGGWPHRVLLLLVLLLAGCSTSSVPLEDAPLAYRQAEDSFRLGNYEKAARGYTIFLDSDASDDYDELVPRAYYRLALSEYRRGRYQECLSALDRMERRLPDREWPQVYTLRGDAELARGKTMSALRWWEQAYQSSDGEERRAAKQHIADALNRMDAATLAKARDVFTTPEMQKLVDARLGGAPARSTAAVPASVAGQRASDAASKTGAPAAPMASGMPSDKPVPASARIGVLLPLSGEYAPYGERSLNGIKLALGPLADRLDVKDTKGDPAAARAGLDTLMLDPNVVAVIGPLRSKEAEILAPRAERAGLPMVVLAQQEGITGQWVMQPAMTTARQASELAEYAVASQGIKRFGILYPNDQYGIALSTAFREQVEQRGGQVVGSVTYDPKQREFSVELLSVNKWISGDGMQALFIPDFAPTAIPLASQLRRAHPDLVLLGSNGWNDPGALGPAAADLDGAVFVDGFFASSTRPATQQFVAAYRGAYSNATPEILEAQAYDAGLLVVRALQSGARSRLQMAQALKSPRTLEGAGGTLGVSAGGIQRQLFLLRLSNGTISEIASSSAPPRRAAADVLKAAQ